MNESNEELVKSLKNYYFKSKNVEEAMLSVDRKDFIERNPYYDSPQLLGYGVTISAPHMHAAALELLVDYLKPGMKALDVGSGSACMAKMVGAKGKVCGIEYIKEVYEIGLNNLKKNEHDLLDSGNIKLECGDGWKGMESDAPFNSIHVGAAAEKIPSKLIDQLSSPGRMIIPVGPINGNQYLMQVDKDENSKVTEKKILEVRYVPLVNPSNLK